MSGTGYSKFFWSDWRSEPKLRVCSLAARGLWIDMLALMAEATPKGELRIGDQAITTEQLATIIGSPLEDVKAALTELESKGVFSRTRAGVAYSRRMCRDEKRRRISVENGKLGGNPSLSKDTDIPVSDNPRLKRPLVQPDPVPEYKKENRERDDLAGEAKALFSENDIASAKLACPLVDVDDELRRLIPWAQGKWPTASEQKRKISAALVSKQSALALAPKNLADRNNGVIVSKELLNSRLIRGQVRH